MRKRLGAADSCITRCWRTRSGHIGKAENYSGARLLQYVTDCIACLSSVREGTGGLIANINGNFRAEVHAMDELIVELKLERQGNTYRVYAFTITKTIEYANDGTSTAKVLDEPKLVVDGTCVLVVKPH